MVPAIMGVGQFAHRPARAAGGQRPAAPGDPGPPPRADRLRAHPPACGDLARRQLQLEQLHGLQPHLLPRRSSPSRQPATIGIPHDTGVDPAERRSRRHAQRDQPAKPRSFNFCNHEPLGDGDDSASVVPAESRSVVLVVAIGGRNQRTSVADDHSEPAESLGKQILILAAEVGTAAGERPEPRRRPLTHRCRSALPTSLGKHGLNPVVRQLLDQPPELVPLRTHTP